LLKLLQKNIYPSIYRIYIEEKKYKKKSIDYYVYVPTETMTIHDSIIESIPYRFQIRGMLW
jgi:hypothetical protein